ncbi:MAG: response regulator transcription factor [Thermomicrobiales bacterium]
MSDERTTVLVVDDEPEIVLLMSDFLRAEGYQVVTASDGSEALTALQRQPVHCMLLDIMMPGMSGFDLLRTVRERGDIPVLILSARMDDSDKIRGLGLGADDYIVKSATPAEVVARVKAVLRRSRPSTVPARKTLEFDHLSIDVQAREVRRDGRLVPLTAREFDLLKLLAEHPRQVFSRDQLFDRLWDSYGDQHTVTVHIGRLRDKLERDPSHPELIVTVWGAGYRFDGRPA